MPICRDRNTVSSVPSLCSPFHLQLDNRWIINPPRIPFFLFSLTQAPKILLFSPQMPPRMFSWLPSHQFFNFSSIMSGPVVCIYTIILAMEYNYLLAAKSLQLCLTLCDLIDSSPPGSSVSGILQARILEWVTISVSNAWKWKAKVKSLTHVRLLATPWTAAYQAPPSMGFSRQEYWSGVPLPSPVRQSNNYAYLISLWYGALKAQVK